MEIAVKIWTVNFCKPFSKCYLCPVAMETLRQLSRVAVVTAEKCVFCCNIKSETNLSDLKIINTVTAQICQCKAQHLNGRVLLRCSEGFLGCSEWLTGCC